MQTAERRAGSPRRDQHVLLERGLDVQGRVGDPTQMAGKDPVTLGGPRVRAWRVQEHSTSIPPERRTKCRRKLGKWKENFHLRSKWGGVWQGREEETGAKSWREKNSRLVSATRSGQRTGHVV